MYIYQNNIYRFGLFANPLFQKLFVKCYNLLIMKSESAVDTYREISHPDIGNFTFSRIDTKAHASASSGTTEIGGLQAIHLSEIIVLLFLVSR